MSLHCAGGEYRILDPDYRDRVLQRLFSLLEEEDWSFKAVPLERCCSLLAELEPRWGYNLKHATLVCMWINKCKFSNGLSQTVCNKILLDGLYVHELW